MEQLELISCLQKSDWEISDDFVCIVARSDREGYSDALLEMIGEKVCANDPGSINITVDGRLVIVADLTSTGSDYRACGENIASQLAGSRLAVGISPVFDDYFHLIFGYQAANFAIDHGQIKKDKKNVFWFDEHIPEYIKEKCTGQFPSKMLSSASLRKFIEKSRRSGDDHLEILKVYLRNNMNIAQTSRDLFMHRNTLLYRLDRIREELGLDLDDPDTRLEVMFSLFLQDEWGSGQD